MIERVGEDERVRKRVRAIKRGRRGRGKKERECDRQGGRE